MTVLKRFFWLSFCLLVGVFTPNSAFASNEVKEISVQPEVVVTVLKSVQNAVIKEVTPKINFIALAKQSPEPKVAEGNIEQLPVLDVPQVVIDDVVVFLNLEYDESELMALNTPMSVPPLTPIVLHHSPG